MNWFEQLTGFVEESPEQVRRLMHMEEGWLVSAVNGQRWYCGGFSAPTLGELIESGQLGKRKTSSPGLRVRELVASVQELHAEPDNAGALFQVASQFNLLEMAAPEHTPEMGVGMYQYDNTQGPACAIAAGAGTIWRNYFMPLSGQTGQSAALQFDALELLGRELGNSDGRLWTMQNGYVVASHAGLEQAGRQIRTASPDEYECLKQCLRIGWQADTQVTLPGCRHRVHQLYCSALPVAYSQHASELWEPFARLVLEAAYEATLQVGVHRLEQGQDKLYLTLLGGGVFGNRMEWILDAIRKALHRFSGFALDVAIVSYGGSRPEVRGLVDELMQGQGGR